MIKLKNIKKNNDIIECDIYPEDSMQAGHLAVDAKKKEVVNYSLPKGYEGCRNHLSHARRTLLELSKSVSIPEEKLVMWY